MMKFYVNSEYPRCNITSKDRIGSTKGIESMKMLISQGGFLNEKDRQVMLEKISKTGINAEMGEL